VAYGRQQIANAVKLSPNLAHPDLKSPHTQIIDIVITTSELNMIF